MTIVVQPNVIDAGSQGRRGNWRDGADSPRRLRAHASRTRRPRQDRVTAVNSAHCWRSCRPRRGAWAFNWGNDSSSMMRRQNARYARARRQPTSGAASSTFREKKASKGTARLSARPQMGGKNPPERNRDKAA